MTRVFEYKAKTSEGRLIKGLKQAESSETAVRALVGEGLLLVDLKEARNTLDVSKYSGWLLRRPGTGELAVFTRQLATMVSAGLPLLRCLEVLTEQTVNSHLRKAAEQVRRDVEAGIPLWQALSQHTRVFPRLYIQMVRSGELGGMLDEVLARLAVHLEKEHEVVSKVRNALLYPMLVAALTLIVVLFIVSFVLPTFTAIFASAGVALPLPTRCMIGTVSFLQTHLIQLAAAGLILIFGFQMWRITPQGRKTTDHLILKVPVVGRLEGRMAAARFARAMGTLISSGVSILSSLEIAEEVAGNQVVAEGIRKARVSIREGENISGPLRQTGVFDPMVVQMVAVGEETGTLDEMLVKVADYYEQELGRTVEALVTMLEPAIVLVMAALVGLVITSTLLPMFDMVSVLR